ncbi:MAG: MlaD family protein [Acidimicrobiales bacterium]
MSASVVRRRERSDLIKFTIFLIVAGLFTYWVGVVISAYRPGDSANYRAVFADVSGLQVGDAVRIAGVDVGKVETIDVKNDATVLVGFSVLAGQPLNASTEATVQYRNLIGDRILQLSRPDKAGQVLHPGDTIPVSRTRPALDLDALLNGFKPLFAGLSPKDINAFSGELIQVLQGQSSAISSLVERTASVTTAIGQRQQLVGQVIRNLNKVAGTFDNRRDDVATLIDQLSLIVDGLNKQDTQVLDAASRVDGFARQATTLLADSRASLRPDLIELASVARGLNEKEDVLTAVLRKLPVHYKALSNTASYGNFFNFFLCGVRVEADGVGNKPTITPWILSDVQRCKR